MQRDEGGLLSSVKKPIVYPSFPIAFYDIGILNDKPEEIVKIVLNDSEFFEVGR